MKSALRTLAAVLTALLVAIILIVAVEFLSNVVHPLPENFGGTPEEMCQHVERIPHWVLAVAVAAWAAIAFVGTWIATRMGNLFAFAIVSVLLLAALVFNISMLPYPVWFKVANLLAIPAAIVAGGRCSIRRKAPGTGE